MLSKITAYSFIAARDKPKVPTLRMPTAIGGNALGPFSGIAGGSQRYATISLHTSRPYLPQSGKMAKELHFYFKNLPRVITFAF